MYELFSNGKVIAACTSDESLRAAERLIGPPRVPLVQISRDWWGDQKLEDEIIGKVIRDFIALDGMPKTPAIQSTIHSIRGEAFVSAVKKGLDTEYIRKVLDRLRVS